MVSSLILAGSLCASIHVSVQLDTVPKGRVVAVGSQGEREAAEVQQVFLDHYISGYYPPFGGSITQIAPGTYRLDSITMRIDATQNGMTGLISRGLLFPGRLAPWFGSTDTVAIGNLYELKNLSPSPQARRFSCWVRNSRYMNPVWYVFELTNQHGTADMDMAAFIRDAQLTFLYQVSIII